MKRKTASFLDRANESLELAIEVFNRPSETARVVGVLLFLNHAFEMLLKAIAFEKTGRVRRKNEQQNYRFDRCVAIAKSQLGLLSDDEALVLHNINGFRDAAAHDLIEISEGLLYGHAQSGIQIFTTLLKKAFGQDIGKKLPRRVLPLSTIAPTDIHTIISEDMGIASALLGRKKRREDEAEARLRPYQVIEANIRAAQGVKQPTPSLGRIVRGLKSGDWKGSLPMVAGLVQSTPTGIPLSLHVTKREGFPVRLDPTAGATIAFRYVKPEDKYPYLTRELAKKLGTTTSKVVGLVKLFGLRGKDEYHTAIKISSQGAVHRYSEKARALMAEAFARHSAQELWERSKGNEQLDPAGYLPAGSAAPVPGR